MDDLISRDAVLERMKSMAGCSTCDNYNYVRCRSCIWNDAMNIVEEMSEVDAAPVEWIDGWRQDAIKRNDGLAKDMLDWLLGAWIEEQEAR